MSHDPLIMYILQPMLSRPIGMTKTSNILQLLAHLRKNESDVQEDTHAKPLRVNCENATPLARVG